MSYHVLNFDINNREYRIDEDDNSHTPRCMKYAIEPDIHQILPPIHDNVAYNSKSASVNVADDRTTYPTNTVYRLENFPTEINRIPYRSYGDMNNLIRVEFSKETLYYFIICLLVFFIILMFFKLFSTPRQYRYSF